MNNSNGTRKGRSAFQPKPGGVYRTADIGLFTKNPARLAKTLVRQGKLLQLAGGIYGAPRKSVFGALHPDADRVLETFLNDTPYVRTGPQFWNALNLGSTAVFPTELVYNTVRTGEIVLDGRRYSLRRKAFPAHPTAEWYAIDLLENRGMAGVSSETLLRGLVDAVRDHRLDALRLQQVASRWGGRAVRELVAEAVAAATGVTHGSAGNR